MELEWELCKIYVACEVKHSERFMVFCSLGSRSVFLEGVMEVCEIFKQKDDASIPHIEEREKTCKFFVLFVLFFSKYLSETVESSVQDLNTGK